MITFEKSSPGSGKNLKRLAAMAFQDFRISNVSGEHVPRPPSDSRLCRTFCFPPPTLISSHGHGVPLQPLKIQQHSGGDETKRRRALRPLPSFVYLPLPSESLQQATLQGAEGEGESLRAQSQPTWS